ncbi:MAG: 4-alpha-glucanotransferase [Ruminiclostridium sp.]|nr:4-alpha-glucanotransferase [Ruminiclostridium sp.]
MELKRSCGVLMHITSLPNNEGIGTLGKPAYEFVDWLKSAGQSYWQVLPIHPTGYGDSPYQSPSTFAGNPLLIDLWGLVAMGLLDSDDIKGREYGEDPATVDYEKVIKEKNELLHKAFFSFKEDVPYLAFIQENAWWLEDFVLFMAIKEKNELRSWLTWDREYKRRKPEALKLFREENSDSIKFHRFVQYIFFTQWKKLKTYANERGIKIIGDIPIYAAMDSADVWSQPKLFTMDMELNPTLVAGVPPDYFSATGQLWGNPLYNWRVMEIDGYSWWMSRIDHAMRLFDVVRIDHFRAFDTYYAIPADAKTAEYGDWRNGPGVKLFRGIKSEIGEVNIIAEDLGEVFDSVKKLLEDTGYPGMRVLQFGFNNENSDNSHLSHNYPVNSVAYTGTHDNDTIMGWLRAADRKAAKMANDYVNANFLEHKNVSFIRSVYQSPAALAIIPMQDVLGLGTQARMNTPSTLGGNWCWRMKKSAPQKYARMLKKLATTYMR